MVNWCLEPGKASIFVNLMDHDTEDYIFRYANADLAQLHLFFDPAIVYCSQKFVAGYDDKCCSLRYL